MVLFEEPFADQGKFIRDWIPGPGMSVRQGVLEFSPDHREGYCVGLTRRQDFRDFSLTVDVRLVRAAVGLALRAVAPGQYYMVQFDLKNDPSAVWFHTFTPTAEEGYRLERVPSAQVLRPWNGSGSEFLFEATPLRYSSARWMDRSATARHGRTETEPIMRVRSVCGNMAERPVSIATCVWRP